MSTKETTIQVSPRIFDHLGLAAYESLKKCLAELAANSYDADATEVRIHVPVQLEGGSVIKVTDNGEGMTADQIEKSYLFIGRDRRTLGQRTSGTKSGRPRLVIGSKGIGKLAGFGVSSQLRLISVRTGMKSTVTLDRHHFDDLKTLADQKVVIETAPTDAADGTSVELHNPNSQLSVPDEATIRRHLFRVLPNTPDFRVYVNEKECTADALEGTRTPFDQEIPSVGRVHGFYVIAGNRLPNFGMAVRVRGRLVKEPNLFGIDTTKHWFFSTNRIYGEINADFLDPEDGENRAHDVINTSRDGFLEDSPVVQKFEEWVREFLIRIFRAIEEAEEKKRESVVLKNPEYEARLNKLPAHVKSTAERVARTVFSKLKSVDQDQASELIDWILKYYESNVLRELISAIVKADTKDVAILSEMIREWGLQQVNGVVEHVKDQISIIKRLEDLISDDTAEEIDLHKLVENNLWLVRQGLELWSSDKPLKTVLDKKVDENYKDYADIRPDIVCRSRDEGRQAVVLEFKRPKEKIRPEHITQAMTYEGIIAAHRPGIIFETYVIGRQYDPAVLAVKEKQAKAGNHLVSYEHLLQGARNRFETILELLGQ